MQTTKHIRPQIQKLVVGTSLLALSGLGAIDAAQLGGFVTEKTTGASLEGTQVNIPELELKTTTNRRGFFSFNNVPEGEYEVVFNYVGSKPAVATAAVRESGTELMDAQLSLSVYELDDFEVKGYHTATARAINLQRSSENLRDVVAADFFGQFADGNAAEALNRLPGISVERDQGEGRFVVIRGIDPSLNSVAIDGITLAAPSTGGRSTLLDTIPIEVLDTLEVTKAVLPDQPGDSIGGHINLRTPSAFDYPGQTAKLTASALYSDLVDEWGHKFNGSYSDTFGQDDQWGLFLTFVQSERTFGSDNVEADPWEDDVSEEIQFREYDLTRERTGVTANIEFKPSDDSLFFFRTSYNNYKDTEVRDRVNMKFDGEFYDVTENSFSHRTESDYDGDDDVTAYPGVASEIELKEREENMRIFVASIGGEQSFNDWTIDYALAYSMAEEDTPYDREAIYATEEIETDGLPDAGFVGLGGGPIFSNTKSYTPMLNDPADIAGYTGVDYSDAGNFEFDEMTFGDQLVEETDLTAKANFKREFDQEHLKYVKFGGLVRAKTKESDYDQQSVDDDDVGDIDTPELYVRDDARNPFNRPVPGLNTSIFDYAQDSLVIEDDDTDSIIEDYESDENVYAAYLMASFEFGEWELIAGARIEHTDFETDGYAYDEDLDDISKVNADKDYTNVLPGVHLRRDLGENAVVRASWTNTIARPTFEQSRAGSTREGDEVERGNPDLDPYEAMNLDASFQYYNETYGVFGIAVFYKDIENFIYEQTFDEGPDEITTFENGDSGNILGLELSYSKQLDFLPGPLAGLSVNGNLTLTDSEATAQRPGGGDIADTTFLKQSDVIGNISLAWEYGRYFVRISGTYRDDYLDEIGEESFEDRYVDSFFQVDAYASVRVYKGLSIFAEVNNIFNEPFKAYWGESGRLSQFEEYGVSGSIGAKWTF